MTATDVKEILIGAAIGALLATLLCATGIALGALSYWLFP